MPSGLRVTRIDRAPAAGAVPICVNGTEVGALQHRTMLELTVAPGELLVELPGSGAQEPFLLLTVPSGCTACVQVGRRRSLGILEASHYLAILPAVRGLPDRSVFPLNLSAHSALEWLAQKRALGERLTLVQQAYLRRHLPPPTSTEPCGPIPTLAQLGAFAALGLEPDAQEVDVREAFRLLSSIHAPLPGERNETLQRLEEAFRVAMAVVEQRERRGVTEVGK